jgi:uncharacterized delta-60 repeat protein
MEGTGLIVYALGEELPITTNGPFQFTQPLPDGIPYQLRVVTQPKSPDQACTITNGSGTLAGADVTDVLIDCVTVTATAALDPAFGAAGKVTTVLQKGQGEAMAIQADGKIVVAGRALGEASFDFAVVRYNPDGSLDTSFGDGGVAITDLSGGGNDEAYGVAIQTDGKIVAVGISQGDSSDDFGVARYDPDGTMDQEFGVGGVIITDFGGGPDSAQAVVIQKNGAIVVVGNAQAIARDNDFGVARYTAEGQLDPSFGGDGMVTTSIAGKTDLAMAVVLTGNEEIVVAGRVAPDGGASSDFGLVRYASDGTLDSGFGDGGMVRTDFNGESDDVANGLVIDGDAVIAAGYALGATSSTSRWPGTAATASWTLPSARVGSSRPTSGRARTTGTRWHSGRAAPSRWSDRRRAARSPTWASHAMRPTAPWSRRSATRGSSRSTSTGAATWAGPRLSTTAARSSLPATRRMARPRRSRWSGRATDPWRRLPEPCSPSVSRC